jgi:hypothetical protein
LCWGLGVLCALALTAQGALVFSAAIGSAYNAIIPHLFAQGGETSLLRRIAAGDSPRSARAGWQVDVATALRSRR